MKRRTVTFIAAVLCLITAVCGAQQPIILTNAHAHNDYVHKRPLFDALDNGFTSVEADIWLVDGKLLVAHERNEVDPNKTLQSLYLDPLRERIKEQGGKVYRNGPIFNLLIELKSPGEEIYPYLRDQLKPYHDLLSIWGPGRPKWRAIQVVITGNVPRAMIAADKPRYAACDGSLHDLDSDVPNTLVPWISASWFGTFHWSFTNAALKPDELPRLREVVAKAHAHGRKVRFWASPDYPKFWQFLADEHVDLANVDRLPEFQKWMQERSPTKSP